MSTSNRAIGKCLCGEVTFSAGSRSNHVGACHCDMCVHWVGGPLMTVDCGSDVNITGEQRITRYSSSDWAERGFCKECGSHLFYFLKSTGQYFIPAGLFDDNEDMVFDHQIFIDVKPKYFDFANTTKNKTRAEMFAQFGGSES